jgi:hypothetical protein
VSSPWQGNDYDSDVYELFFALSCGVESGACAENFFDPTTFGFCMAWYCPIPFPFPSPTFLIHLFF